MGLDQYLRKSTFIGGDCDFREISGVIDLKTGDKPISINLKRVSYIIESVGYWRKANQIHSWFVENVQKGEDDCREYYVSVEQLKELLSVCKEIKENMPSGEGNVEKAIELLPPTQGFFFGQYECNKAYFYQIESTIEIIEDILKEHEEGLIGDYYYQSSW